MKYALAMLALSGCGFTRAIKDSAYPDYVELELIGITPEQARTAVLQCQFQEPRTVSPGQKDEHIRSDVLECADITPMFETLSGARRDRGEKL